LFQSILISGRIDVKGLRPGSRPRRAGAGNLGA
jgi:hypothetical protein